MSYQHAGLTRRLRDEAQQQWAPAALIDVLLSAAAVIEYLENRLETAKQNLYDDRTALGTSQRSLDELRAQYAEALDAMRDVERQRAELAQNEIEHVRKLLVDERAKASAALAQLWCIAGELDTIADVHLVERVRELKVAYEHERLAASGLQAELELTAEEFEDCTPAQIREKLRAERADHVRQIVELQAQAERALGELSTAHDELARYELSLARVAERAFIAIEKAEQLVEVEKAVRAWRDTFVSGDFATAVELAMLRELDALDALRARIGAAESGATAMPYDALLVYHGAPLEHVDVRDASGRWRRYTAKDVAETMLGA